MSPKTYKINKKQCQRLLDEINSPADLKKLSLNKLPQLAEEIRREIIAVVSQTGGHLASALGAVEIILGLHYVLDTPRDKIIWDVGHQAYAHKLLTGRKDRFKTLRQWRGLSGFPNKDESIYDTFTTGHGSTSISTALGLVVAEEFNKKSKKPSRIAVVIGDASLGGGMALEALNHAGQLKKNLVVILNDNRMSISPSVGALSRYLNRIITAPTYNRIRKDVEKLIRKVPKLGIRVSQISKKLEEGLKGVIVPGLLFEELGFRYFGPIDVHDIKLVVPTLKNVFKIQGPILVHMITKKGKGHFLAERTPEKFHGVGGQQVPKPNAQPPVKKDGPTYTQVFSKKLIELAYDNPKIVAITAAMPEGTGLDKFGAVFPEKCFDVGMAEQHAVGFAAGLAKGGLKPVVAIYSTFLQRSYDQIAHDICLQDLPVVLAIDRAGLVGEDGPTHHGMLDLAYLCHMPKITVLAPAATRELEKMLEWAFTQKSPVAIRFPRGGDSQNLIHKPAEINLGRAEVLKSGKDVLLLALGSMVYSALQAADILLKKKIKATVVNMRFLKPLDVELLGDLTKRIKCVVTIEEGVVEGGLGSAVLEVFADKKVKKLKATLIGLPREFIEHGPRELLLEKYGLSPARIAETAEKLLK